MKRILCLVVAVLLAACGAGDGESQTDRSLPVVEMLVMGGSNERAAQRISEAASELTVEQLGCRVSIRMVDLVDYESELARLRVNRELPDLLVVQSKEQLSQLAQGQEIVCLDDFLQEEDILYREVASETEWKNVTLGSKIYGVPFGNNQPYCFAFVMRQDICDALGVDPAAVTDLDELYMVLCRVQQAYPKLIPVAPNYAMLSPNVEWDGLTDEAGMSSAGVLLYRDPMTDRLELITRVPEFWQWCETMYRWRQEGLLMENCGFNQEPRQVLLNTGAAFGGFVRYSESSAWNQQINYPGQLCYAILSTPRKDYADNGAAFCISKTAEDPALCIEVLRYLYSDDELLGLCTFGQEGVDFTVENGQHKACNDQTDRHVITLWCWPNNDRLMGGKQVVETLTGEVTESPAAGFLFDTADCGEAYDKCIAVMEKYYQALVNGEVNPTEVIPQMEEALKKAGVEQLLDEQQRQLEEWQQQK